MRLARHSLSSFLLLGLSGAWVAACGPNVDTSSALGKADPGCVPGSAQYLIGDGFSEMLCGCAEPGGQIIGSGKGQSTCTVPVGTEVFFYYTAAVNLHQLVAANGSLFPASPLADPLGKPPVKAHAFKAAVAGSYDFADAYDLGVTGKIVAQ